MKEKRDKKGRKWRLVKPARPIGTYITPFFPHDIELFFPLDAEVVAWEEYILSTGELVAFVLWRKSDGSVSFGFVTPLYLSAKGVEEAEKLYEKSYEYWLNRAVALLNSQGVPRKDVDLPPNV